MTISICSYYSKLLLCQWFHNMWLKCRSFNFASQDKLVLLKLVPSNLASFVMYSRMSLGFQQTKVRPGLTYFFVVELLCLSMSII